MTKERQEALDHFNRFLDMIDLYEAQTINAVNNGKSIYDIVDEIYDSGKEIGHELLYALPGKGVTMPLIATVLSVLAESYRDTIEQITGETEEDVQREESNDRKNQ